MHADKRLKCQVPRQRQYESPQSCRHSATGVVRRQWREGPETTAKPPPHVATPPIAPFFRHTRIGACNQGMVPMQRTLIRQRIRSTLARRFEASVMDNVISG